ncbi:protein mahjong [Coccinella septempunctata]|uniref:protein mahjong n=1 Tax=Coccinella septempunctata TaxID=41139 RepID=UPI001D08E676|nr:protein mahjong [Coccinella septempunctata]
MADTENPPNPIMTEVTNLIKLWESENSRPNYDPLKTITRLAEIIEVETDNYMKMDPDPFDERHPSRIDPECKLGQILKALFKKDNFMNKLVNDYMRDTYYSRLGITRDVTPLNVASCRLMLDIMPGLETSVVFEPNEQSLVLRLIKWTTSSAEPLQSYATGLLAAALELPEVARHYREHNSRLTPICIQRLQKLQIASKFTSPKVPSSNTRPFAHFSSDSSSTCNSKEKINGTPTIRKVRQNGNTRNISFNDEENDSEANASRSEKRKKPKLNAESPTSQITSESPSKLGLFSDASNSSWAELESYMIGSVQMHPLTPITQQILILRFLTPMGEYQEFLPYVFENNALGIVLNYLNIRETKEARLAFEALKYLAALLCHKKFCVEFILSGGLEVILDVPRPSIAATGVSICIYYLGYCDEAMERLCLLPKHVIVNLVNYSLWLLECSHDSGRCHAIMFFGLTFKFRAILDEFDAQDGLRKLHNVISTLPILLPEADTGQLNEDQECSARQVVRHVCVAYRRYLEAHLYSKYEIITRCQIRPNSQPALLGQPSYKACKQSPEEVQQQIETLLQHMPFRGHWGPVDQLLKLGCINLLLKIIAFAYEWNYSGRAETVRSALDVLAIACVLPKVQLLFCERVDLPDDHVTVGMNIILGAAEGEIVADADVQKAALRVIVNCVCGPVHRIGGMARFTNNPHSPSKKLKLKSSEDLIQKVWDCVRSNSGIMVLLTLMNVKTPITDADSIRTLACKALAGLARSETVKQIISKLPLITSGQLQTLIRDPILQEKRQEHVYFQKYALELLERLSGNAKQTGKDLEISLANIHRANVVAQTKIQFNEDQLLQLIHQHLVAKGLSETASHLVKEANLSHALASYMPKFKYSSTLTPNRNRSAFSSPRNLALNINAENPSNSSTPQIKIIKKNQSNVVSSPVQISRLEKPISNEITPHRGLLEEHFPTQEAPRVTLTSIITEYLTNQHALCKNPMATCPQFNLFVPHKCPDPKPRIAAANNMVLRCARRAIGYNSRTMDRKFIHSRFCPIQTIRSVSEEGFFTSVRFLPGGKNLLVGDYYGEIHNFNRYSGNVISSFNAHENYIANMEPSRDGKLLLTSSIYNTWGKPISALWQFEGYQSKWTFDEEEHVEFSKVVQDKILGTKGEVASLYDVNTGQLVSKFIPTVGNQYTKNKATFSHQDDLILSDGVLFDVNSGKQIHKLDKLNQMQSGVFHPNGLEIVSNSEVWDMRTFHLLKTVPALNQCTVIFSGYNNVIYASVLEQELDDEDLKYDTSFKTLDSIDYSSIATIDVKKNIYDLAINHFDSQLALVENQGVYQTVQESVVRVYDVGRRREDIDEEQDEDEEEEDMDASDEDGSDNGDSVLQEVVDFNNDNSNNDDDDANGSESGSESWTSLSSNDSDSDDSMVGEVLLF